MKWLNGSKMRLVLLGFVAALVLGGGSANADFIWGTPTNLGPEVNSSYGECGVCISANGLEFYFMSDRPGGYGGWDLWIMKRPTIEDDWGDPMNLGSPANSQYSSWEPSISSDGLSLYFSDGHTPQFGNQLPGRLHPDGNIWMIKRETVNDAWGAPENIGPAVNSEHAVSPSLSADGLSLYFQSHRPGHIGGHCDIMVATRETIFDSFGSPVFLRNVNSADGEWMPDISVDGRTLFFCRSACTVLWMARRATVRDDFGPPVRLPAQINVASTNASPTLSADGRTLYFSSNRAGGIGSYDLWQVSINPVVDFNGDGIVDIGDLLRLIESWGQDDPAVDIGPMPWGDGIVDIQDLVVLTEYIEPIDRTLVAHWAFDETEGMFAADSAGDNDAVVIDGATWQPGGGQVDGALQFNGVDGYAIAGAVLNPADGPFSVLAWINGGAPGQVVVSQQNTANWLAVDAEGNLMTELKCTGRSAGPLFSETVITDGQWHRIGLVWDGSHRTLYVDGFVVADDIQPGLQSSQMGLYIGTGKAMEPGTYFSGLIDDIRVYNRAVSP
jgi:hypothetical protein